MALIAGVVIKDKCIVKLKALQQQDLKELHINHMGIKKPKLLASNSVYLIGMNAEIENHMKIVLHALIFSKPSQKKKRIHHAIPGKPQEVIGADMSTLNNKDYLYIIDYHSKFPIVKKGEDMSADSLILACKLSFQNLDCQRK